LIERMLNEAEQYPKLSPFSAVRWIDGVPEVSVRGDWYELVAIDDVAASEIMAFSQTEYGRKWKKRFEEDLVELLTRLGHAPGESVALRLRSSKLKETLLLPKISMTADNRRAIRAAAQARGGRQGRPQPSSVDDLDRFWQDIRPTTGFSGVCVVAKHGEPLYARAFGWSHLATQKDNTLDSPFRIASLSKQFTAAAIFYLEGQGKLGVREPVSTYLEEFRNEPYRRITLYHLLTHTSGLPRIPNDRQGRLRWQAMSRTATPVGDYVKLACETPLNSEPGTEFEYSNFGYRVLSAVISEVTEMSYADFMEDRIFTPLGMTQTGVARVVPSAKEEQIADALVFLDLDPDTQETRYTRRKTDRNYGTGYGSGGIYSSARDLLIWDRVLAQSKLLTEAQTRQLFEPFKNDYACGWKVVTSNSDGKESHFHSGANEGFLSRMMRLPDDDVVIIVLGNIVMTNELDDALDVLFPLCRSLPHGIAATATPEPVESIANRGIGASRRDE